MPRQSQTTAHPAASTKATQGRDATQVLTEDHRAVQKLFDAFEQAKKDDLDAKATLVRRACEELTVHAMIEEELLYPAAQEALNEDDRPNVEEAYVEHFLVKVLIEKFATLKPDMPGFDATFKVLSDMRRRGIGSVSEAAKVRRRSG